jgi:hypothetical protein
MVLALKNGVPALAIDPVAGGGKIQRQAETISWPIIFTANALSDEVLQKAFDYCLTVDAKAKAKECRKRAVKKIQVVRDEFITALSHRVETTED